ncbi:MAG: MaoC family dehydratase [Rhodospirillales bacterium]
MMREDEATRETLAVESGAAKAGDGTGDGVAHGSADGRTRGGLYLEDLWVGQRFRSGSLTVDEAEVKAFAARYDPQPFHLDAAAAEASLFRGLAASGWHTAALSMRLFLDGGAPIAGGVIGASGELAWPRPTRPGDTLTVESEVLAVVPSKSRPDRGHATLRSQTLNQAGEPVQIFTMNLIVPRRPPA